MRTKDLAKALVVAALMHETSWSNSTKSYTFTLEGASLEGALQCGLDCSMGSIVYYLLNSNWNDALDWAKKELVDEANRG